MFEVKWEIFEEEGRTIKAVFDLTKLPCQYFSKNTLNST